MSKAIAVAVVTLALAACASRREAAPTTPSVTSTPTPPVSEPAAEAGPVDLAFVLLASPALPDPAVVVARHRAIAPDGPALTHDAGRGEDALGFHVGDLVVNLVMIPAPIPAREADDAARFGLRGITQSWSPAPHRAHLIVASLNGRAARLPLERVGAFHQVVASIVAAMDDSVAGVYIGGNVTQPADFYVDAVRGSPDALMAWMGVSVAREGDRLSLLSLGIGHLGLPDVLMTAGKTSSADTMAFLFDLLLYVGKRGKALPEGDTVGRDDSERLPVHYVPSPIDAGAQVMKVELP